MCIARICHAARLYLYIFFLDRFQTVYITVRYEVDSRSEGSRAIPAAAELPPPYCLVRVNRDRRAADRLRVRERRDAFRG